MNLNSLKNKIKKVCHISSLHLCQTGQIIWTGKRITGLFTTFNQDVPLGFGKLLTSGIWLMICVPLNI